jgi:hypothetical protein
MKCFKTLAKSENKWPKNIERVSERKKNSPDWRVDLYFYSPILNSTRFWRVGEWLSAPLPKPYQRVKGEAISGNVLRSSVYVKVLAACTGAHVACVVPLQTLDESRRQRPTQEGVLSVGLLQQEGWLKSLEKYIRRDDKSIVPVSPTLSELSSEMTKPEFYSLTDSMIDWLTPSLLHSLTHLLTHSLPHSLAHSLTHSINATWFLPHLESRIMLITGEKHDAPVRAS